jgi:hypothetical protein
MDTGPARLGPLSDYTANYRPVLLSERAPYINKEESNMSNVKKLKSIHGDQKVTDMMTNWPTDRRSQNHLNLNLNSRKNEKGTQCQTV